MATLEELTAQVEALSAALAEFMKPPPFVERWEVTTPFGQLPRTCQDCGAEAEVIDASSETRALMQLGEGYCLVHGQERGILDREHRRRPRRP